MSKLISLNKKILEFKIPETYFKGITDLCLKDKIELYISIEGKGFVIQKLVQKDSQKIFSTKKSFKVNEEFFQLITEESIYTDAQRVEKLSREKEDIFFSSDDKNEVENILKKVQSGLPFVLTKKQKNILCAVEIARLIKAKYSGKKNLYKKNRSLNAKVISDLAYLEENKLLRLKIYNQHNKKEFKYDTFYRRLCDGITEKKLT